MSFNESRILDCVAYGSEFGHRYRTRINELRSGVERRNGEWERPLGRYSIVYQNLRQDDANTVVAAHHACMGRLIGFRFKDWADYQADDEVLGFGTGAVQELQLVKTYQFGSLSNTRNIYKPVPSITVYENGSPIAASVDYTTGIVTITATLGAEITWSGEFDVPVRFADDEMSFSIDNRSGDYILNNDVELLEIRV